MGFPSEAGLGVAQQPVFISSGAFHEPSRLLVDLSVSHTTGRCFLHSSELFSFSYNRYKIRLILTKATLEKTESKISRLWQMLRLHYAAGMGWRPLDFDGSRGDLETNNNKTIFFMQSQSSFCMFFYSLVFYTLMDT